MTTARLVAIRATAIDRYVATLATADGDELEFELVVEDGPVRVVTWSPDYSSAVGSQPSGQLVLSAVYRFHEAAAQEIHLRHPE